ncbi:hypothetical protein BIW11_04662 [Tropilaelaps mercedesae]|uniref:Uncharacterized protein n=1 Tax=Tropilaelaps mercedesae TaxID=418985 RepID=A0A1V9X3G6_9ACAR|nr:hypothetical protein BIW11_04662 [Tropilaelaps mercedesae]
MRFPLYFQILQHPLGKESSASYTLPSPLESLVTLSVRETYSAPPVSALDWVVQKERAPKQQSFRASRLRVAPRPPACESRQSITYSSAAEYQRGCQSR